VTRDEPVGVSIKILDKDYRIACQPQEQEGLMASARLLDQRMREIRMTGKVIGTDRIAVLAALNLAHELVQVQRAQAGEDTDASRRLARLQERVAETLAETAAEPLRGPAASHSGTPHLDAPEERA
jgi:cell division protein ZapA